MSFMLVSAKTVRATHNLVKEFIEMEGAPADRPLSERRLRVYRNAISEGIFRPCNWASCYCKETGDTYRVNGKHTSVLLSEFLDGKSEHYVNLERYEAETLHDVAVLYATFDSKTQSRSKDDLIKMFAASMPELTGLPLRAIDHAVMAASVKHFGFNYNVTHPAPERVELIFDYGEFCNWWAAIAYPNKKEDKEAHENAGHLRRGWIAAVALSNWEKAKGAATEFWKLVRDQSHPDRHHQTRELAIWLIRVGVVGGNAAERYGTRKKGLVSPREVYVRCLKHWNAWRTNTTPAIRYSPNEKIPAVK